MKSGFGKIFKELRLEKELTQLEAGKIFKVATTTISSWERCNSEPSFEQLKIIADFFEVSTDYLLEREDF